jgi:hypothetical protein
MLIFLSYGETELMFPRFSRAISQGFRKIREGRLEFQ